MTHVEAHYAASNIEERLLNALRAAGLDLDQRLVPEDLAALDHFHTGGLQASLELLEQARIRSEHRVLDIGAGLGGAARLLASKTGCRVDCIELTSDYCIGAALLNRLTGLDERIHVHQGSALELPFSADSFDVTWMQNVGMNIEDKAALYAEIARVLKPGGRFAFQEIAAGASATSYFPLPWAAKPEESFLISVEDMQSLLVASGFVSEFFEDASDAHLQRSSEAVNEEQQRSSTAKEQGNSPIAKEQQSSSAAKEQRSSSAAKEQQSASIAKEHGNSPAAAQPLSLSAFVDNLAEKASSARRSLVEGQIRLVKGVFRAS